MNITKKDWVEDFKHENGMYQNYCIECGALFLGHKRRFICRECFYQNKIIRRIKRASKKLNFRSNK